MRLRNVGPVVALCAVGASVAVLGGAFDTELVSEEPTSAACKHELTRLAHAGFPESLSCKPVRDNDPTGPSDLLHR